MKYARDRFAHRLEWDQYENRYVELTPYSALYSKPTLRTPDEGEVGAWIDGGRPRQLAKNKSQCAVVRPLMRELNICQ